MNSLNYRQVISVLPTSEIVSPGAAPAFCEDYSVTWILGIARAIN